MIRHGVVVMVLVLYGFVYLSSTTADYYIIIDSLVAILLYNTAV